MFAQVEAYAGDPIFRLGAAYHADPRQKKVDLTVGLYYDENGDIPLLDSVYQAEKKDLAQAPIRPYLPIEGLASYREAVQRLVFGENSAVVAAAKVATIQSIGGTGALKVGGDFLHDLYPDSELWLSDPAWDNHHAIFRGAGIHTHTYRYYDKQTKGVDFDGMVADLNQLKSKSIVLLHPCCHNPTGVDLTKEQWQIIAKILQDRDLIPFVDMAYQGFGDGLDEDAYLIHLLADLGMSFLVANSFSKNFSFYAERCGALSVVCQSAEEAERVLGQLKAHARRIYSNPPRHGGMVVATVLTDPALAQQWRADVEAMRLRILKMRQLAYECLQDQAPNYDSSYLINQKGMFSYTGLSLPQLQRLRDEFAVYLIDSGRMSMPGLNDGNVVYFAESVAKVVNS